MKLSREFYKPSEYSAKIVPKGVKAEIYLVDEKSAMGFGGKRSKPDFNYLFRSKERRDEYVKEYIEGLVKDAEYKSKRAAEKRNFVHDLKVGSILYSSWGYDQTNIDFYEVVELVGKKSVKILPIGKAVESSSTGADYVVAIPGSFSKEKEPMLKRVSEGNSVRIESFSNAYLWDGKPKYETAFGWGH